MKLKKLLNETFGGDDWRNQFHQMRVYDNPFHRAFKPVDEKTELGDVVQQVKVYDKPKDKKMLTIKVINRLKELRNKSKSSKRKKELQSIIDKVENDYNNGKYLKEMKNFRTLIENFFKRKDMPQIKSGDLDTAVHTLKSMGIGVKRGSATPDTFNPSQKDIYMDKVDTIIKRTSSSNLRTMKPLVVSNDNYIVDGHHRWKALQIAFSNEKIPYLKIDLPLKRAVQMYNHIADKL